MNRLHDLIELISHQWRSPFHWGHHAIVATVIALSLLLFQHNGWLKWLDVATFRLAAAWHLNDRSSQFLPARAPLVVDIDTAAYETAFGAISPLRRERVAELVEAVHAAGAVSLAVDIDLSPNPANQEALGQERLDQLLADIAKSMPVVLVVPLNPGTQAVRHMRFEWVRKMCKAGVGFGISDLVLHQGVISRRANSAANLGAVLAEKLKSNGMGGNAHVQRLVPDVCELARTSLEGEQFFDGISTRSAWANDPGRPQYPLNLEYLKFIHSIVPRYTEDHWEAGGKLIAGRPVFLGGSWGNDDVFLTPVGNFAGVSIHAATLYSVQNEVRPFNEGIAVLLDVVFGVMLGFVFTVMWTIYANASRAIHGRCTAATGWAGCIAAYCGARLVLVVNLLIPPLLLVLFIALSGSLISYGLWLNPGPIVVGMFLHALLIAKSTEHAEPENWTDFYRQHPDIPLQIAFVLFVLISVLIPELLHHGA